MSPPVGKRQTKGQDRHSSVWLSGVRTVVAERGPRSERLPATGDGVRFLERPVAAVTTMGLLYGFLYLFYRFGEDAAARYGIRRLEERLEEVRQLLLLLDIDQAGR